MHLEFIVIDVDLFSNGLHTVRTCFLNSLEIKVQNCNKYTAIV